MSLRLPTGEFWVCAVIVVLHTSDATGLGRFGTKKLGSLFLSPVLDGILIFSSRSFEMSCRETVQENRGCRGIKQ